MISLFDANHLTDDPCFKKRLVNWARISSTWNINDGENHYSGRPIELSTILKVIDKGRVHLLHSIGRTDARTHASTEMATPSSFQPPPPAAAAAAADGDPSQPGPLHDHHHDHHDPEDAEIFEIVDFTAASPWERFLAQVEARLRSAMNAGASTSTLTVATPPPTTTPPAAISSNSSNSSATTTATTQPESNLLTVDGSCAFSWTHHKIPAATLDADSPFTTNELESCLDYHHHHHDHHHHGHHQDTCHPLHRWTGLRQFFLLTPVQLSTRSTAAAAAPSNSAVQQVPAPSASQPSPALSPSTNNHNTLNPTSTQEPRMTTSAITAAAKGILLAAQSQIQSTSNVVAGTAVAQVDLPMAKWILSACAMAPLSLNDVSLQQSAPPIFLQIGPAWRLLYGGVQCVDDVEIRYKSTQMPYVPRSYDHLTGLVDLFRSTFQLSSNHNSSSNHHHNNNSNNNNTTNNNNNDQPAVEVAIRCTHKLVDFDDEQWRGELKPSLSRAPRLTFGPRFDPIDSLVLIAEWPWADAEHVVDNAVYSELLPSKAPMWMLRVDIERHGYNPNALPGLVLTRGLERAFLCFAETGELMSMKTTTSTTTTTTATTAGTITTSTPEKSVGSALLGALKERGYTDGVSLVDRTDVESILQTLFTCAPSDQPRCSPVEDHFHPQFKDRLLTPFQLASQSRASSSAPYRGFSWQLAFELLHVLKGAPGKEHLIPALHAFLTVLWKDIAKELRYRWENKKWIPNILMRMDDDLKTVFAENDASDMRVDARYNLLTQKLCMLKCCIYTHHQRSKDVNRAEKGGGGGEDDEWKRSMMDVDNPLTRMRKLQQIQALRSADTASAIGVQDDRTNLKTIFSSLSEITSDMKEGTALVKLFDRITTDGTSAQVAENSTKQAAEPEDWQWNDDDDEEVGRRLIFVRSHL